MLFIKKINTNFSNIGVKAVNYNTKCYMRYHTKVFFTVTIWKYHMDHMKLWFAMYLSVAVPLTYALISRYYMSEFNTVVNFIIKYGTIIIKFLNIKYW